MRRRRLRKVFLLTKMKYKTALYLGLHAWNENGAYFQRKKKKKKKPTKTDTYTFNGAIQIKSFAKLVAIVVVFLIVVAVVVAVDVFVTLVNLN